MSFKQNISLSGRLRNVSARNVRVLISQDLRNLQKSTKHRQRCQEVKLLHQDNTPLYKSLFLGQNCMNWN